MMHNHASPVCAVHCIALAKLQGYKKKSHCPPLKCTMTSLDSLNEDVVKHLMIVHHEGRLVSQDKQMLSWRNILFSRSGKTTV